MKALGDSRGFSLGDRLGASLGVLVEEIEFETDILWKIERHSKVGDSVGDCVGDVVGDSVGDPVGNRVGDSVGDLVGVSEGVILVVSKFESLERFGMAI